MNPLYKCAICCVLSIVALPVEVKAQSTIPLHWSTNDGNQYLELNGTELHLKPRTDSNGPRTVTAAAKLNLADAGSWQLSFGIRFGALKDGAGALHLMHGATNVGWVGADGFNNSMGVFIGKDNEVTAVTPDLEWHHIKYISNGSTLTAWLDDKQVGSGPAQNIPDNLYLDNGQDMGVPCHQGGVWVRDVKVNDEAQQAPLEQPEMIDARPSVILVQNDEQSVCCLPGDTLRVAGHYSTDDRLYERFLDANGSWLNKSTASGKDDDYSYNWTASKPGKYQLNASYLLQNNVKTIAHSYTVNVLETPPVIIPLPKSAVYDVRVVAQAANKTAFHADRISFQFNGNRLDSQNNNIMETKLPINSLASGNYMLSYEAVDNNLGRFVGNTVSIYVPERLQVKIASNVTLIKPSDQTQANTEVSPGVTISNLSYLLDGQSVKSVTQSPFTASLSLSTLPSGTHSIQAVATDSTTGRTIKSPVTLLTLVNQPDDANKAHLAVLAAQKQTAEEQAAALRAKQQADEQARLAKEEAERPAREAAAKRAKLDLILSVPPKVPGGELARKCALAIGIKLANTPIGTNDMEHARLEEITDIKSSDSKLYPLDVYTMVKFADYENNVVLTIKEIFSVNPDTGQVSEYVRRWGE